MFYREAAVENMEAIMFMSQCPYSVLVLTAWLYLFLFISFRIEPRATGMEDSVIQCLITELVLALKELGMLFV